MKVQVQVKLNIRTVAAAASFHHHHIYQIPFIFIYKGYFSLINDLVTTAGPAGL